MVQKYNRLPRARLLLLCSARRMKISANRRKTTAGGSSALAFPPEGTWVTSVITSLYLHSPQASHVFLTINCIERPSGPDFYIKKDTSGLS
ncbi:Mobile element protein [Salisediminibacterium beveridgei]|uniref:Mobile element protein n=1 Tax=Salisediminibacterium beveridgei TaxID=632773 RepID=A0A1D7QR93_9BACI|nr:Mobile element protein [Salisediminibacterium beveridgei]